MKLLMYDWRAFTKFEVFKELEAQGIELDLFNRNGSLDIRAKNEDETEEFIEKIRRILKEHSYDAVFSINFVWEIAKVCNEVGIMYIAWTYDSPALAGNEKHHYYDTNRIFMFDSKEIKYLKRKSVPGLYHLNLAVNALRMNRFNPSPAQKLKYNSDISFVGQLYDVGFNDMLAAFNEYAQGFLKAVLDMQMKIYGQNIIKELITGEIVGFASDELLNEKIKKYNKEILDSDSDIFSVGNFRQFLHQAVANRERVMLLSLLSKHHQVTLYSPDKSEFFENIRYGGVVDYMKEMPYVFKCSKINLNITMRSIESGIPQRCIDVMGCHSFLLTNYQEDLFEEFKEGKSVVTYRSLEEAVDKADFYLRHDTLRNKIADNAYKIVKNNFSYRSQLSKIWKITGLK